MAVTSTLPTSTYISGQQGVGKMSVCKEELFERIAPIALHTLALVAAAALATPVVLLAVLPMIG
jgi:hypothetical protein